MTDVLTVVFNQPETIGFLFSFLMCIGITMIMIFRRMSKISFELVGLNFAMFFGMVLAVTPVSPVFLILFIFVIAGLAVVIMNQVFLGTHGFTKIYLDYTVFFLISFSLINSAASYAGQLLHSNAPAIQPILQQNCASYSSDLTTCSFSFLTYSLQYVNLTSPVTLVDYGLIIPLIIINIFGFMSWVRGVSPT